MMCNYFRFGGVARDLPAGWLETCRDLVFNRLEHTLDQFERLLTENEILVARCKGVGALPWQEMVNLSVTGPMVRSAGLDYDIRKVEPYSIYDTFDFNVPTHQTGDMFDRYIQRIDEARESIKILKQALDRIPTHGPVRPDKKVWNPKVPAGELYSRVEHPKGELGFYLISDGGSTPIAITRARRPLSTWEPLRRWQLATWLPMPSCSWAPLTSPWRGRPLMFD